MNLLERLAHFEKHQLEEGDEYGAEALHHASTTLRLLAEVGKAAKHIHNVYDPEWELEYRSTKNPTVYEWTKIQERARDNMERALFTALANDDCRVLIGGDDE